MTSLFLRITLAAILAGLAAGFIAGHPASAAELRQSVEVDGAIVTIGDLFEDAGALAAQPVFRAPELGVTGALPAGDAIRAATAAGLAVDKLPAFDRVTVIRRSTTVEPDTIVGLIREAAAGRFGVEADSVDLVFDREPEAIAATVGSSAPLVVADIALQSGSGRFTATLSVDIGGGERKLKLSGRAVETMAVPVLTRPLGRRDVIHAGDITTARIDKRRVPGGAVIDAKELIEMALRRPLRAGEVIAAADVEPPRIILRGDVVTLQYTRPGLTLTARGRALADGAKGDLISVLNEQSKRTIQGVVGGTGVVEVNTGAGPAVLASAMN